MVVACVGIVTNVPPVVFVFNVLKAKSGGKYLEQLKSRKLRCAQTNSEGGVSKITNAQKKKKRRKSVKIDHAEDNYGCGNNRKDNIFHSSDENGRKLRSASGHNKPTVSGKISAR